MSEPKTKSTGLRSAWRKGRAARAAGLGLEACPYVATVSVPGHPSLSLKYRRIWIEGWTDGAPVVTETDDADIDQAERFVERQAASERAQRLDPDYPDDGEPRGPHGEPPRSQA